MARDDTGASAGWYKPRRSYGPWRLKIAFLAPLVLAIVVMICLQIMMVYDHGQRGIAAKVENTRQQIARTLRNEKRDHTRLLEALMGRLHNQNALQQALAARDRARLLRLAQPQLADLRRRFGVTRLSFSRPNGEVLARAHHPDRHGDVLKRWTTRQAVRTEDPASGIELGPMGTLTLRLVVPWRGPDDRGPPIGLVGLGMELETLLSHVQAQVEPQLLAFIHKEHLDRQDWVRGMRMLGRTPAWERFPDWVLNSPATQAVSPELARAANTGRLPRSKSSVFLDMPGERARAVAVSLRQASGEAVGRLVALVDVSPEDDAMRAVVRQGGMLGLGVGGALVLLFLGLLNGVTRELVRRHQALEEMATHDGLTGLYNHRLFHYLLREEFARIERYGGAVALLMLDLDHFKAINDEYGHVAGDQVLKGLSHRIVDEARGVDSVCRYGGEEIAVILPETNAEHARGVAERIRAVVAANPFEIGNGKSVWVTASMGVAAYPDQGVRPKPWWSRPMRRFMLPSRVGAIGFVCSPGSRQSRRRRATNCRGDLGRGLAAYRRCPLSFALLLVGPVAVAHGDAGALPAPGCVPCSHSSPALIDRG